MEAFGSDLFSEFYTAMKGMCGFGVLVTRGDFILWFAEVDSMRSTSDLCLVNLIKAGHTFPSVQSLISCLGMLLRSQGTILKAALG